MVKSARKRPVDENHPKRALSGYFTFVGKVRAGMVKKFPDIRQAEVMKKIGSEWNKLSEAEKGKYNKLAAKDQEAYKKRRDKYVGSANYKKHQEAVAEWKVKESKRPFKKDPNRPSKGMTAFLIFTNEARPGMLAKGMQITEVMKETSKQWAAMGDGEKAKWEKKAAASKVKYEKEIAKYEKTAEFKAYQAEREEFYVKRKEKKDLEKAKLKKKNSKSKSRSVSKKKAKRKSKSRSRAAKRKSVSKGKKKGKGSGKNKKSKSRSRSRKKKI